MDVQKNSNFESHPIAIAFHCITVKYASSQWEVQIKMTAQIFGQKNNDTAIQGTTYVSDMDAMYTPYKAFSIAVQQIMKGDKHWRPLLYHDREER